MNEIDIIEAVYRDASRPVAQPDNLAIALQDWYQAYPAHNYLQPCVIDGKASLVCQKHLSSVAADAYRALQAICEQYGIYLKEDARVAAIPGAGYGRRKMAVVLTFCMGLMAGPEAASAKQGGHSAGGSLSGSQTHTISQLVKNQTLSDVTRTISAKTGIHFKFNAAVQGDLINQKILATDWKDALDQLLQGYNYSTVQERDEIKTVFITGYKRGIKPGVNAETPDTASSDLGLDAEELPSDGSPEQLFDNRVTLDIEIPIDQLAELAEGGDMSIDLPVGAFSFKQEDMVSAEDGTLSWIGTMEGESSFYRVYIAKTPQGDVVGNVYTPDGAYNIETQDGQTVMVEIDLISPRIAGL